MSEIKQQIIDVLKATNIITSNGQLNKQTKKLIAKHLELEKLIMEETAFLDETFDLRSRLYSVINLLEDRPGCATCGEPMTFNQQLNRFNKYCSNSTGRSCAKQDPDLEKKRQTTIKKKYGVTNPMQNPTVREKRGETMMSRYGVTVPIADPTTAEKIKQTLVDVHGVDNISQIPGVAEKRAKTNLEKYGATTYAAGQVPADVRRLLDDKQWLEERVRDFTIQEIATELDTSGYTVRQAVAKHDLSETVKHHATTSPHRQLLQLLDRLGVEYEINNRTVIAPKELDIWIPSKKLAIEFNGIYFHSELSGKHNRYHLDKLIDCRNAGVRLLQVWSNEWEKQPHIVESRIKHALGLSSTIYARQCAVVKLTAPQQRSFFVNTHIQGYGAASVGYGLEHDGRIVAAMCFVKSRFSKSVEWELLRFSTAVGINVVGGAGKLFKHFVAVHSPMSVVSYCDYRWGTGNLYEQLGFKHTHDAKPNYFYFQRNGDTNDLKSRVKFQKHKLKDALSIFDPSLTEWQNMTTNGYDRIWDCGNGVFVWSK